MAEISDKDREVLAELMNFAEVLKKKPPKSVGEWNAWIRTHPPKPFGWRIPQPEEIR